MKTKFKIDKASIVDVLLNNDILIPIYQRNYTWGKEHVLALLEDIKSRKLDGNDHYFGVIASKNENFNKNGKPVTTLRIIDGQQRLTTSLILLVYLGQRAKSISQELATLLVTKSGLSFKHEILGDLKDNIDNLVAGTISNLKGRFKENYKVISEFFASWSDDKVQELYDVFCKKFIIANLSYEIEKNDEMLVFENLNSKGSPLKSIDLIKNHIISLRVDNDPKDNLREFNSNLWNNAEMYGLKTITAKTKAIEKFFDFYINFRITKLEKFIQYSTYKNYKKFTKQKYGDTLDELQFDEHMFDLKKYFDLYLQILTKTKVGENIWIRTLSQKDGHISLLFFMFDKYGDFLYEDFEWKITEKLNLFIKEIAIHVVKLLAVEGTGQSFSNLWNDITIRLNNDTMKNHKDLKKYLTTNEIVGSPKTPSDKMFVENLLMKEKQRWIPRALIEILEHIANISNKNNEKIQYRDKSLEHIFPQRAKVKEWPEANKDEDEINRYLNQIGNLMLVDKSINSSLGNKSFNDKKLVYDNSLSPLSNEKPFGLEKISGLSDFTFKTIRKRTIILSKIIIKYFNNNKL